MSETPIMRDIQLAFTKLGHRLFRNQSGTYELKDGRWLSSGLCSGASDLIGWTNEGYFLAVEVKAPGARTKKKRLEEQINFLAAVNAAGGIGFFATSVEEAVVEVGIMILRRKGMSI